MNYQSCRLKDYVKVFSVVDKDGNLMGLKNSYKSFLLFSAFSLWCFIATSITSCNSKDHQHDTNASSGGVHVSLHLIPDKAQFEAGELLGIRFSIENNSELSVEINNAIWCNYQLAFTEPGTINLIDPQGDNLLQPYHVNTLPDHDCAAMVVEPGSKFFSTITLSNWIYIREPGEYRVWLDLVNSRGEHFHSNILKFETNSIPGRVPQERIEIALNSEQMTYTIKQLLDVQVRFRLTFTNTYTETVTILKPQSGSYIQLINPIYRAVVKDNIGRGLHMVRADDASIGEPVYDETTTISLLPGESETISIPMPYFPEMRQPGQYEVSVVYMVRDHAVFLGMVTDEEIRWTPDVFVGVLESNSIVIKVIEE